MSDRPSIPRPVLRPSAVPPVRAELATLILDDEDIVGVSVAPIAPARKSSAPPPPPSRVVPTMEVAPVVTPRAPVASIFRLSHTDPTDAIFDGVYGLSFARSSAEAASMCAETLARALKARAVVVHTHDLESGELRAIGTHGDGDFDILGTAEPSEDDLVASAVIVNQRSVTMRFDGSLPGIAPKRLHHVGAPRTVVAAPAIAWGRCLAIVEVFDADERFAGRVADSATYVADHLAQFLSARAA